MVKVGNYETFGEYIQSYRVQGTVYSLLTDDETGSGC
jgi:hypothetical protein